MGGVPRRGVELRFTSSDGVDVVTTLEGADPGDVVTGLPVRAFGWYPRMGHYPGWFWSVTTRDLMGYESLLERDRLLLADFDTEVTGIASQPFAVTGFDGATRRRHVPDFF